MTFEIILYKTKTYADGSHPIMLKFTNRGERKFWMPERGFSIHEADWSQDSRRPKKVIKKHPKYDFFKKIRTKLNDLDNRYTKEIDKLEEAGRRMTIDQLRIRVENPVKNLTVFKYFDRVIKQEGSGKYGYSRTFVTCLARIKDFTKNKDFDFHQINLSWLNDWRDHMKGDIDNPMMTDATLSIYFRTLRTVINKAIGEGFCDERDYPFGKKNEKTKFTISQFKAEPNKRSISQQDHQRIKSLDLSDVDPIRRTNSKGKEIRPIKAEDLQNAQMLYLFSYYSAGINYNDIARLIWNQVDLDAGIINYTRTKTKKKLSVNIHPFIRLILEHQHIVTGKHDENYVFDILHKALHQKEKDIRGRIHRQMRLVNESLKEIQKMLSISTGMTTYVARHSVITHMIENNTRIDVVQKTVGHSNIATTMGYVANAKKKEIAKAITSLA